MSTTIEGTGVRALEGLRGEVRGPVFTLADAGLMTELAGYNVAAEHRPLAVVGATGPDDVAAAVRWAAARGLAVAVQGTGHGSSIDDGAVMVSTKRMNELSIDPQRRIARVGAGVKWRAVIDAAAPYGLATLNGSSSDVGVVGYTLGGGMGPMIRKYGWAADHVTALEMITADGVFHRATPDTDADLYWGALGAKDALGIVTAIEFELMPVARLYGGALFYAADDAAAVLHAYREWAPTLPEDTTTSIAILRTPPMEELPEPIRGKCVIHLRYAHLGPASDGEALLAPMRAVAASVLDGIGEMPYAAVDAIHMDPPDPMPFYERGTFLTEFTAETVDALLAAAGPQHELPLVIVEVRNIDGAGSRPAGNCAGGREYSWVFGAIGILMPELRDIVPAVCGEVQDALAAWDSGQMPANWAANAHAPAAPGRAWSPANQARLAEIKRRYDPNDVFRAGYGVCPSGL